MSTRFTSTEVPVLGDHSLFIDGNSKITASTGTYDAPVPNALSLPNISTCPGATPNCMSSCYVHGLKGSAAETYEKYIQNERVIHRLLMSEASIEKSSSALGAWIAENCKEFRWHVSGDVMSDRYASWIVRVAQASPETTHWIYTRSLPLVPTLKQASNLVVNISADKDNREEAFQIARETGSRVCWLTPDDGSLPDELQEGDVIFPDYPQRGRDLETPTDHPWWQGLAPSQRKMVCPPDFFGQSEHHRCGPCRKCMV